MRQRKIKQYQRRIRHNDENPQVVAGEGLPEDWMIGCAGVPTETTHK